MTAGDAVRSLCGGDRVLISPRRTQYSYSRLRSIFFWGGVLVLGWAMINKISLVVLCISEKDVIHITIRRRRCILKVSPFFIPGRWR